MHMQFTSIEDLATQALSGTFPSWASLLIEDIQQRADGLCGGRATFNIKLWSSLLYSSAFLFKCSASSEKQCSFSSSFAFISSVIFSSSCIHPTSLLSLPCNLMEVNNIQRYYSNWPWQTLGRNYLKLICFLLNFCTCAQIFSHTWNAGLKVLFFSFELLHPFLQATFHVFLLFLKCSCPVHTKKSSK